MAKYEFKKFKPKKAKLVDKMAVRVVADALRKITNPFRKFRAYAGNIVVEQQASRLDEINNQIKLDTAQLNEMKADKELTLEDYEVMYNLKARLEKLEKIKAKLERKNPYAGKEADFEEKVEEATQQPVNEAEVDIPNSVTAIDPSVFQSENPADAVSTPAEEIKPVETQNVPVNNAVETPAIPVVAPVVSEVKKTDALEQDFVPALVERLQKGKEAEATVAKLTDENKALTDASAKKDTEINGLRGQVSMLGNDNKELTKKLEEANKLNGEQATRIADLNKVNASLNNVSKENVTLGQKLQEYQGIMDKHKIEFEEMNKELSKLRGEASSNITRIGNLEADMSKIAQERDFYKSQILALRNAIGTVDVPVTTNADVAKTR